MGKITEKLINETYGLDSITINGCILIPFYQVIDKLNKLAKIEQIVKAYDGTTSSMITQFSEIQKVLEQK